MKLFWSFKIIVNKCMVVSQYITNIDLYAPKMFTNNEKAGTIFLSASREVWPQTTSC